MKIQIVSNATPSSIVSLDLFDENWSLLNKTFVLESDRNNFYILVEENKQFIFRDVSSDGGFSGLHHTIKQAVSSAIRYHAKVFMFDGFLEAARFLFDATKEKS